MKTRYETRFMKKTQYKDIRIRKDVMYRHTLSTYKRPTNKAHKRKNHIHTHLGEVGP